MRAMILAAGLGTRLKPLTNSTPKALIKIHNHSLLELQIKKLKAEGFDEIIINVHHFGDRIKEYLKKNIFFDCSIEISDESNKLLDTGGGLKKAAHFFSDGKPFLVHNVDILSNINLKNFMETHLSSGSLASLAVQDRKSSRKFLFDKNMTLFGWINEKTGEQRISRDKDTETISYAFSGIQAINPKLFKYFPDKDIFSLVELYLSTAKQEKINGFVHNKDEWMDLGNIVNLDKAEEQFDRFRNTYPV